MPAAVQPPAPWPCGWRRGHRARSGWAHPLSGELADRCGRPEGSAVGGQAAARRRGLTTIVLTCGGHATRSALTALARGRCSRPTISRPIIGRGLGAAEPAGAAVPGSGEMVARPPPGHARTFIGSSVDAQMARSGILKRPIAGNQRYVISRGGRGAYGGSNPPAADEEATRTGRSGPMMPDDPPKSKMSVSPMPRPTVNSGAEMAPAAGAIDAATTTGPWPETSPQ